MEDHLVQAIVLVDDLPAARRRVAALGLNVLDGGRHPGRGTANLIVPFGDQYLELLAVVDEAEALASPQGRPVLTALTERGPGLARWSVEASDITSASERVGLPIERRQRIRPDGTVVAWRSVGVDTAWAEPWRCAFMAWDDLTRHPARSASAHPNGATGFARLELQVPDPAVLLDWLGGSLPSGVTVAAGDAGPCLLLLDTPGGPLSVG